MWNKFHWKVVRLSKREMLHQHVIVLTLVVSCAKVKPLRGTKLHQLQHKIVKLKVLVSSVK